VIRRPRSAPACSIAARINTDYAISAALAAMTVHFFVKELKIIKKAGSPLVVCDRHGITAAMRKHKQMRIRFIGNFIF
jgi:hypothetical protein